MLETVPVEEISRRLPELIPVLQPGDEIKITSKDQTIARVIAEPRKAIRQGGFAKGKLVILKEDDEHLEDFREYMD